MAFASSAQVRVSARNMLIQSICDADRFQSGGRGLQAEWNLFHLILFQREDNKFFLKEEKQSHGHESVTPMVMMPVVMREMLQLADSPHRVECRRSSLLAKR